MDAAKLAAAATAEALADEVDDAPKPVNFLSPQEMAAKAFEDRRGGAHDAEEEMTHRVAEQHHHEQARARYEAVMADRKRRADYKKAKAQQNIDKARAEKRKRKKMKKRSRR